MELGLIVLGIAALAALTGVAWFTALREHREGMRPNIVRASALSAILILAVLAPRLVSFGGGAPLAQAPPDLRPRLQSLRQSCPGSRADVDAISLALYGPDVAPTTEPAATAPTTPPPRVPWGVVLAVFALLAVGVVVLVAGGDRTTLPLRAWWRRLRGQSPDGPDVEATVARAAGMAAARQYEEALALVTGVEPAGLATFVLLDLLFLRAFCAAELGIEGTGERKGVPADRKERFAQAERDIEQLLRLAPEMAEALYLRATIRALDSRYEDALKDYRAARPRLGDQGLPFDQSESACLLELGVAALEAAEAEKAAGYFAEVEGRKVLAAQVPLAHVTFRLGRVQKEFRARKMDDVRRLLKETRAMAGLDDGLRKRLALVCDVYDVLTVHREGDAARSGEVLGAFLAAHLPANLPPVDEETAEEFLDDAALKEALALPATVYRAFFFLLAVAAARRIEAAGRPMTEAAAAEVVTSLLRALQFSPRNREALAGLGVVYYWFMNGKRRKGREWIRAATTMGVRSAVLRRLLDEDRRVEAERQHALEAFLGASMRFLTDATVKPTVRRLLVEELGRFQEFQPLLLELGDRAALEPQPVTLDVIRDRSAYIAGLVAETGGRASNRDPRPLKVVGDEYRAAATVLSRTVDQIEELERRVFAELGRSLME